MELTGFSQIHAIGTTVALLMGAGLVLVAQLTAPLWVMRQPSKTSNEPLRSPSMGLALFAIGIAVAWTLWHAQTGSNSVAFDGAIVIDRFTIFFALLFTSVAAAVAMVAREWTATLDEERAADFYALLLVSTAAMVLLSQANDLIAIFIALETTSIAQFTMAGIGRDARSSEAGLKYLLTGAIAAAVLLYGFVFLFGVSGTTSLEGIAEVVQSGNEDLKPALLLGFVFIVAGLGFKMSLVPSHGWVPDVYQGAPPPVASFLSVASKAAGFAVMLRILYVGLGGAGTFIAEEWALVLGVLAAVSMFVGNLGALWQSDARRLLGYSSIAQAGNIAIGLAAVAVGSTLGPSAVLFFLGTYAATNLGAFFVVITVGQRTGSHELEEYIGLVRRSPLLAGVLGLCLLSLTGIPPTAGFIAKLYVFNAAVRGGEEWLVAIVVVGVLNTAISAFYYLRWAGMMVKERPAIEERPGSARGATLLLTTPTQVILVLAATGVLLFGLLPTPLISAARRAAEALIPVVS